MYERGRNDGVHQKWCGISLSATLYGKRIHGKRKIDVLEALMLILSLLGRT